jgi:C1A family cysteine protease
MKCSALFALATIAEAQPIVDTFHEFKQKFNRIYKNSEEEEYRRKVFNESMAFINAENAKNKSYKLGVTDFADITFDEFKQTYLTGYSPQQTNRTLDTFHAPVDFIEPAGGVDWSTKGAVTPVKNQAQCGSCWSFSTTGALEGAAVVAGRKLVSLSEQNILDCDKGGHKCQGGSMEQAFGWVKTNGICSEDSDSYKCANQMSLKCIFSKCASSCTKVLKAGDVTGYTQVGHNEKSLEAAVTQQPVSVAIEADRAAFQHYKSGVLTSDACGENLDHGVLAVGYGTYNGQKYWKVKNSWGTGFGEKGYIRIAKGASESGGECGIRKDASYPTVKKASDEIVV